MSRFVRPETTTLTLENGDHLTIRKRLTSGEQRAAYARIYNHGADGKLRVDPMETGIALIEAYLLDWDLTDDDGVPWVIRPDKHRAPDLDALRIALDTLDYLDLVEIKNAIEAHERAETTRRLVEKKRLPAGETPPSPISVSPADADGRSTPSEDLIPMITRSS